MGTSATMGGGGFSARSGPATQQQPQQYDATGTTQYLYPSDTHQQHTSTFLAGSATAEAKEEGPVVDWHHEVLVTVRPTTAVADSDDVYEQGAGDLMGDVNAYGAADTSRDYA